MTKPFILFVDDDQHVLSSLRRMFFGMAGEWDMSFVSSGQQALDLMAEKIPDILIVDAVMPGMDGAVLLERTVELCPSTVRIVLSGQTRQDMLLKLVNLAHQYIQKPVKVSQLTTLIMRLLHLRSLPMQSPHVRCLADIKNLPALPTVYHELQIKFSSSESSLRDLGAVISKDVALSAAVLKLVNSSFFGLANQVISVQTAATLLGYDILRALVLHHVMFTKFAVSSFEGFSVVQNQNHSLNAAGLARQLAMLEGFKRDECDRVFVGTVVHDIGKLILAERFPEHFKTVLSLAREKNLSFYRAEETLGFANHAAIGAYLLGLWGFDDQVVSAVLYHHDPGRCPSDNMILPFLHAADCIEGKQIDSNLESLWSGIDEIFLARCGYAARKEAWTREVLLPEETQ